MVLGAVMLGAGVTRRALAQPAVESASVVVGELSPAEAMRAFGAVERWARAGTVGDGAGDAPLPAVHGASVTVRVAGAVVGRGTALAGEGSSVSAIRGAAEKAIGEARNAVPRTSDAMLAARAAMDFWSGAMVSVEFAGPLVPLDSATYDDVDADVRPGIEGVAVRVGSKVETVFPAAMLMRGIGPGDALASAISRAVGEPGVALREDPAAQPAKLAETRGVRCYRFRTVHVAHTSPGSSPIFLDRGGRVVRNWPRRLDDVRAWCGSMAHHLIARRRVENGVVEYAGTYRPVTGRFDAPGDSALEEILAARALLAFAQVREVDPGDSEAAIRAAIEIVDTVARRGVGSRGASSDAASAALWTCVLPQLVARREPVCDENDDATWPAEWRASYREAIVRAGADVPEGARGVPAFALARRAGEAWPGVGDRDGAATMARAALDAIYGATAPGRLVTHMPWLGWGELCLRGGTGTLPALREMRESVYAHQLHAEAVDPDNADLAGGIVFTGARSPLPTWHTARIAAFLASAIADARLTDSAERPKEMARLIETLRFLRQLTADEACGFMYADPARASGGVRAALWDQRQTLEATALTLIAGSESLRAARPAPHEIP